MCTTRSSFHHSLVENDLCPYIDCYRNLPIENQTHQRSLLRVVILLTVCCGSVLAYCSTICVYSILTLSRATEQYCATGAILKPLYLNRQHFCSDNTCQKLFPGHISISCLQTRFSCNTEIQISHYMCTAISGLARGRVNGGMGGC